MDNVYEFCYSSCVYESAAATVSVHASMKGAYMAMKEHKLRRYEEWRSQRSYYFQKRYKFGWMESWFIIKTKVLP